MTYESIHKQQIIILSYLWSTNYAKIMTLYKILAGNNILIAFLKILISLTWGPDKIKASYSHLLSLIIKGRLFSRKKLVFFRHMFVDFGSKKAYNYRPDINNLLQCGKASSHISLKLEEAIIIHLAAKERSAKKRQSNDPISATHERCRQRGCSSFILESGDTTWIHRQCLLVLVL